MNPDEKKSASVNDEKQEVNAEETPVAEISADEISADEITVPCCSEQVHIAYRGKADDRLYLVRNRKWQELRFFQNNGLRVFCAMCRHRVY